MQSIYIRFGARIDALREPHYVQFPEKGKGPNARFAGRALLLLVGKRALHFIVGSFGFRRVARSKGTPVVPAGAVPVYGGQE